MLFILTSLALPFPACAQNEPNLLANPGFEAAGDNSLPAGWVRDCSEGSSAGRVTGISHTGDACGHILKSPGAKRFVSALVFPTVPVKPGTRYTLSGWGRSHVPNGLAHLFMYQYGKNTKWLGCFFSCPIPADTDAWTPLRFSGALEPECEAVQVRLEMYGEDAQGEAWVDDVYFGEDTTPPGPARDLQATTDGKTVRLTWSPPEGETPVGYHVARSPYAHFRPAAGTVVGEPTTAQFSETVPAGYAQFYAVTASDQALNTSEPAFAGPVGGTQANSLPEVIAWTAEPDLRVGPDLPYPPPQPGPAPVIQMARAAHESLQVLVGSPEVTLKNVQVALSDLTGPGGATIPSADCQVLIQDYVEMVQEGRVTPDPLPPARPVDIAPGTLHGWWLILQTSDTTPAGDYEGAATVSAAGQPPTALPIRVHVWPVTVPRANHYGGSWGIWGEQLAQQEGVAVGSPEYKRLWRRYWDFFLEHRMVPRGLPVDTSDPAAAEFLNDERISAFSLATPAGWGSLMNDAQIAQFKEQCDRLREKGWLGKSYLYNYDEPEEGKYAYCVEMAQGIRKAGADIPILLTEQPEDALIGSVDIWCPILSIFADTRDRCRERQAKGEHVWWYVCCGPGAPWPNYMLTNDPIDGRVLSWLQVKHKIEGELYWAVTCYPGDVWSNALTLQFPGDGYLCYPGKPRGFDGPVSCIRAEVIRDAKEDIELIWLLRKRAADKGQAQQAEAVIARALEIVCPDFTRHAKRQADITRAREMVLQELVRLSQMP